MSDFKFIDFVTEGKLIRNNTMERMSFTDVSDLVLLYFLALQTMRYYPQSRKFVRNYATDVLKWNDWSSHRNSGNDMYNLLTIIDGDKKIVEKLKDPKSALIMRERTYFPTLTAKRLLRDMASGKLPSIGDAGDIMKIDSSLKNGITSYSILRRKVSNYIRMNNLERKDTVTRLENALKARGRNSDLVDYYVMFIMSYDLESNRVKDTEPTISISDPVEADVKDINMLRLLGVPTKDLPFAYKALSIVSRGQALPPRFSQAYQPIMQIIDDIVKAGPGYVNLLKQVHNKAKKAKR